MATADEEYKSALGHAVFSYALLEYRLIWILEKLSPGYINTYRASFRATASKLAGDLEGASKTLAQSHPAVAAKLTLLHSDFVALGRTRNDLLHANPASAPSGDQILIRQHFESYVIWDLATVKDATAAFDKANLLGGEIFESLP